MSRLPGAKLKSAKNAPQETEAKYIPPAAPVYPKRYVSSISVSPDLSIGFDTYLPALVPNGATTGFVTATTPSGTVKSNKQFRVGP
jgi:hypothetical protein